MNGSGAEVITERTRLLACAEDLARGAGHACGSVHLLLALFTRESLARDLLHESGLDHRTLLTHFRQSGQGVLDAEPHETLTAILEQADALAARSAVGEVDGACLLASLLRIRGAAAPHLLRRVGVDVASLRARVIGSIVHDHEFGSVRGRAARRPSRPMMPGVLLGQTDPGLPVVRDPTPRPLPIPAALLDGQRTPRRPRHTPRDTDPGLPPVLPAGYVDAPSPLTPPSGMPAVVTPPRTPTPPPASPASLPTQALPTTALPTTPLPAATLPTAAQPVEAAPTGPVPAPNPPSIASASAPSAADRARFELDPERFPTLSRLGRNLTLAALDGETTPLVGRDALVDAIIDVLLMRRVNNPCLVGEAGVGKTALVEGLAARIAGDVDRYGRLAEAVIIELPVSSLLAGTSLRGAFAERMAALRDEVAAAEGGIIVFIDEIHTLMGAGAGDGPLDAANDLKTALARGRFPLIGATTRAEYRRFIEADPAMERRFQVIDVPEPSVSEAVEILVGLAPTFGEHHGIPYSHEAIVSAVELSRRFLPDRALPDKAVAVLDRAGAQARRRGHSVVDRADVARSVAVLGGVPIERLLDDEQQRLRDLGGELARTILGQTDAVDAIARRVARNHVGLGGDRPLASFVFAGPPGVGKGAAAAALAELLFLNPDALVRFDMSDYAEPHSVSRLIGSPPGYVGHQQAGQLSEALHRRPYRVLLFDDLDRAAPEVAALVLQLVETGRMVDNQGRRLDARNAVIVATTTLSPEQFGLGRGSLGFTGSPRPSAQPADRALAAVSQRLGAEITGRVDEVVLFRPLEREALAAIAAAELERIAARLLEERLIRLRFDPSVVALLLDADVQDELGARWLRGRLSSCVEDPLGEALLDGTLRPGERVLARVREQVLRFEAVAVESATHAAPPSA